MCTKDFFDLRPYNLVPIVSSVVKMASFYPILWRSVMKMPFTGILVCVGIGAEYFVEGNAGL